MFRFLPEGINVVVSLISSDRLFFLFRRAFVRIHDIVDFVEAWNRFN